MLKFFHPPQLDSEGQTNQAQTVNIVLMVVLLGGILFLVLSGVAREVNQMILMMAGAMILIVLGLKILLHAGHVQLVSYLLSFTLWAIFSIPIYLYDGIRDVAIGGYYLVIAITSLVLRGTSLLSFVVLASLSVVGAYLAETEGVIVTTLAPPPTAIDLVTVLIALNLTALLTHFSMKRMAQTEVRVRQERDKAQQYLDIAGAIIIALDATGVITLINKRGCQILGYEEEEILGKNGIEYLIHPDQQDKAREDFGRVLTGQSPSSEFVEYTVLTKSGRERVFIWSSTVLENEDGEVVGTLNSGRDITDRVQMEKKLAYIATHDYLTNLPNRRLFSDRLEMALAQARLARHKVAVMMMDLDQFKEINDTLGHSVGDQLLQDVSLRIKGLLRTSDTVARMGGDEFTLVLPAVSTREAAGKVAAKILAGLRPPLRVGDHHLPVTASIGIAIYPDDGDDGETLMKHADIAMYRAKEDRDNSYRFFSDGGLQP